MSKEFSISAPYSNDTQHARHRANL